MPSYRWAWLLAVGVSLFGGPAHGGDAGGDAWKPGWSAGKALDERLVGVRIHAVARLRATQREDGSWHNDSGEVQQVDTDLRPLARQPAVPFGTEALTPEVVCALLAAGVPAKDRCIRRAVAWVHAQDDRYATSGWYSTWAICARLRMHVLLDPVRYRDRIHADARTILAAQRKDGTWDSNLQSPRERRHREKLQRASGSQRFGGSTRESHRAARALWIAQRHAAFRVPSSTWGRLRRALARAQREDHTWSDEIPSGQPLDATSSAAGLACYIMARAKTGDGLAAARRDSRVLQGWKATLAEAEGNVGFTYARYAHLIEEVAALLQVEDSAWFPPVARELATSQDEEGHWPSQDQEDQAGARVLAFGLACLAGSGKRALRVPPTGAADAPNAEAEAKK